MNPYFILAALLALVAAYGGGRADGTRIERAKHLTAVETARDARDAALQVTADAIAKIEVRNVTIRQQAETIVREVPVYQQCRHDPDGLRLVNEAISGAGPTGAPELPGASAPDR
jgi:hypothetical protein